MGKSVNTNLRPGSSGGASSSSELSGQGRFDEGSGFSKPEQSSNQVQQQTASSSGNQASSEPAVDADEEKRKAADRKMSAREKAQAKRGRTYELKPHDGDEALRKNTEYEMEQERLEREALAPSVKPAAEPVATASSAVEEPAEAGPSGNGVSNDEARAVLAELAEGAPFKDLPDGRVLQTETGEVADSRSELLRSTAEAALANGPLPQMRETPLESPVEARSRIAAEAAADEALRGIPAAPKMPATARERERIDRLMGYEASRGQAPEVSQEDLYWQNLQEVEETAAQEAAERRAAEERERKAAEEERREAAEPAKDAEAPGKGKGGKKKRRKGKSKKAPVNGDPRADERKRRADAYRKAAAENSPRAADFSEKWDEYKNGSIRTERDRRIEEIERRRRVHKEFVDEGLFPVSDDTWTDNGVITFGESTKNAIGVFLISNGKDPNDLKDQQMAYRMAARMLGLSPDTRDLILNREKDEFEIPAQAMEWAWACIMDNMLHRRHPLDWSDTSYKMGGTRCYSAPVLDLDEAEWILGCAGMEGSPFADGKSLSLEGQRIWNEKVYPNIKHHAPEAQRRVLEANMRFLIERATKTKPFEKFGLGNPEDAHLSEIFDDVYGEVSRKGAPDIPEDVRSAADAAYKRVMNRKVEPRPWNQSIAGEPIDVVAEAPGYGTNALRTFNDFTAFMSVAANYPLYVSNAAEALLGQAHQYGVNHARWWKWSDVDKQRFMPTNYMNAVAHSREMNEALATCDIVRTALGAEGLLQWVAQVDRADFSAEGAARWMEEAYGFGPDEGRIGKAVKKLREVNNRAMSGEWIVRGSDGTAFLNNFMTLQKVEADAGHVALTAGQVEAALANDPVGAVMDMLKTNSGQSAYHQMRRRTMGGSFLIQEKYDKWARGRSYDTLRGELMRFGCSEFVSFYIRMAENLNPALNTTQWLSVAMRAKKENGDTTWDELKKGGGGIAEQEYACLLASTQLRECLLQDMFRLPGMIARAVPVFLLCFLGKVEPPDDDDKKGLWDELRLFCEYDEEGNPIPGTGTQIRMAWWLQDVVGWAGPFGTALAYLARHKDLGGFADIMLDGMGDIWFNAAPGKIVDMVDFVRSDVQMMKTMALGDVSEGDDWMLEPDSYFDFFGTQMMVFGLTKLNDATIPAIVQSWLNKGSETRIQGNPFKVYDEDGNVVANTSWSDVQIRSMTQNHTMAALFMNMLGTAETGYLDSEMPPLTALDLVQNAWYRLGSEIKLEMGEDGYTVVSTDDERTMDIVNSYIQRLAECEDAEDAYQQGLCIGNEARYAIRSWCWYNIYKYTDDYNAAKATTGLSGDARSAYINQLYEAKEQASAYWQNIITKLDDWDIPTYPETYGALRTDLQEVYRNADGERVNKFLGEIGSALGLVDKSYDRYGNIAGDTLTLSPFSYVYNPGDVFDAETALVWQGNETDPDWLRSIGELLVSGGKYDGQQAASVSTVDDQTDTFTLRRRAYVPLGDEDEVEELDPEEDGIWIPEGYTVPASLTGNVSGYVGSGWYSTRSGSSSSYNPKIYSNARSVNADKAASMYAKTPYSASKSYLRPAFYTKGSREAYRRQDM